MPITITGQDRVTIVYVSMEVLYYSNNGEPPRCYACHEPLQSVRFPTGGDAGSRETRVLQCPVCHRQFTKD